MIACLVGDKSVDDDHGQDTAVILSEEVLTLIIFIVQ